MFGRMILYCFLFIIAIYLLYFLAFALPEELEKRQFPGNNVVPLQDKRRERNRERKSLSDDRSFRTGNLSKTDMHQKTSREHSSLKKNTNYREPVSSRKGASVIDYENNPYIRRAREEAMKKEDSRNQNRKEGTKRKS